jgi:hypothetical protein
MKMEQIKFRRRELRRKHTKLSVSFRGMKVGGGGGGWNVENVGVIEPTGQSMTIAKKISSRP